MNSIKSIQDQFNNLIKGSIGMKKEKEDLDSLEKANLKLKEYLKGAGLDVGVLVIALGLMYIMLSLASGDEFMYSLVFGLIVLGAGVFLLHAAIKKKTMNQRLPHYLGCFAKSNSGSLDGISATLGYPYDMVVADITFMIEKDILENSYINHSKRVLVSPVIGKGVYENARSITCPNCGATNEAVGKIVECEFCGTVLS